MQVLNDVPRTKSKKPGEKRTRRKVSAKSAKSGNSARPCTPGARPCGLSLLGHRQAALPVRLGVQLLFSGTLISTAVRVPVRLKFPGALPVHQAVHHQHSATTRPARPCTLGARPCEISRYFQEQPNHLPTCTSTQKVKVHGRALYAHGRAKNQTFYKNRAEPTDQILGVLWAIWGDFLDL